MKKIFTLIITLATMIFAAGCVTGNNHLAVEDFCQYLIDNGVPVTQVQPLRTEVFAAQHAWAFQIDGKADQEIGVYKYDITNNKMRERLEKYQEDGYAMAMGLKYPVIISGSFMLIGVEKNPYRTQIEAAAKGFANL